MRLYVHCELDAGFGQALSITRKENMSYTNSAIRQEQSSLRAQKVSSGRGEALLAGDDFQFNTGSMPARLLFNPWEPDAPQWPKPPKRNEGSGRPEPRDAGGIGCQLREEDAGVS